VKLALSAARGGPAWADAAAAEYGKRMQRYFPFEELLWKPAEEERFWKNVPARTRVVLLDERGQELSSPGLAAWLEEGAKDGIGCLHFAIGGAYGHPAAAHPRAWKTLKLSAMVLNQAVARVVMLEQLYRACTIRAGEPYHHG
jgi:23S rRNA (pseudouridine1915-N3)-methyltransferase